MLRAEAEHNAILTNNRNVLLFVSLSIDTVLASRYSTPSRVGAKSSYAKYSYRGEKLVMRYKT